MKYCSNCGAEMADNQLYCTRCDQANRNENTEGQANTEYAQQNYGQTNGYNQNGYTPNDGSQNSYNTNSYSQNGFYMSCPQAQPAPRSESGMVTAIKVLLVIGTIYTALCGFLIPLLWCVPMTISYFNKIKRGEPISTAFKVCSLLFVSLIAGILMLVDSEH